MSFSLFRFTTLKSQSCCLNLTSNVFRLPNFILSLRHLNPQFCSAEMVQSFQTSTRSVFFLLFGVKGMPLIPSFQIRTLIKDIRDVRFHKIEAGMQSLSGRTNAIKVSSTWYRESKGVSVLSDYFYLITSVDKFVGHGSKRCSTFLSESAWNVW